MKLTVLNEDGPVHEELEKTNGNGKKRTISREMTFTVTAELNDYLYHALHSDRAMWMQGRNAQITADILLGIKNSDVTPLIEFLDDCVKLGGSEIHLTQL